MTERRVRIGVGGRRGYIHACWCARERVWRPTRAGGGARAEMLGSFCVRGGREEKRENRGAGEDEVGRRAAREA